MSRQTLTVVLSAVAGLLIVPVAVNVGTGGDAPPWLKPFLNWLWPIAIACVLLVIVLELWAKREPKDTMSARRPNDPRNVDLALTQVARYVNSRQHGTLGEQVRIALALDERPEVVRQPAHLVQRVSGDEFQLSADLTIADVFTQMNESILILGAPGAGKTTQLLDLAQALIAQARSAPSPAIPVVLDLADWVIASRRGFFHLGQGADDRAVFSTWLLASLADRFKIPEDVGLTWLSENRLTLLLDGLDEVPENDREQCAAEINALQRRHGVTRVAVCSRESDYARLTTQLQLQGAVVIRPLDRDTVQEYLASVSPALAGVVAALEAEEEMWDLLTTPLMLTIMILARVDQSSEALTRTAEPTVRRRLLFDAYVVEVLARRRSNELGDPERTLRAIRTLAEAATKLNTGVRVPPLDFDNTDRYLPEPAKGVATLWIASVATMAAGIAWITASALHFGGSVSLISAVIGFIGLLMPSSTRWEARVEHGWAFTGVLLVVAAVPAGLAALVLALFAAPNRVLTFAGVLVVLLATLAVVAAGMRETSITARSPLGDQILFISIGLSGAGGVLLLGLRPLLIEGWALGIALGTYLATGAAVGMGFGTRDGKAPVSVKSVAWTQRILYVLASLVLVLVLPDHWDGPFWEVVAGFLVGLLYAMVIGLMLAISLGNLFVRVSMIIAGEPLPWRRSFLRFATDRSLLTHTDGEHRFIHLLVRDHLAACDPARLGRAVILRRAELLQSGPVAVRRSA